MLDEDTDKILSYMATNGLVANPKKSVFMLLNQKGMTTDTPMATIRVGEAIESFTRNTAKIWNQAPIALKEAKTLALCPYLHVNN